MMGVKIGSELGTGLMALNLDANQDQTELSLWIEQW